MWILGRVFRKVGAGSLRGIILTWMRVTIGIGLLTLPYYVSKIGIIWGAIFMFLGCFSNWMCCNFIFDARC
jgi:amino acid permease